ncbi:MAG: CDP-diacylglycerol--serine O-phosphatidyltransferase [Rhodobacterales bacterium]
MVKLVHKSDTTQKSDRELPLFFLLPNLITVGAICAGLTAIRFAFQGNYVWAVSLILLACVLDGLDGRIARYMKSESQLGAELDSLADFANFGIAPALVIYAWALQDLKRAGWIAVLFFAVCCVMRLARFNADSKSELEGSGEYFTGVPAPAGAMLVLLPMFLSFLWPNDVQSYAGLIAVYMGCVGLLLVSRIPTYSFKTTTVRRRRITYILAGFAVLVAMLLTYPWLSLVALDMVYFAIIIWSFFKHRNRKKAVK